MVNSISSNGVYINGNQVIINGEKLPPAPCPCCRSTVVNGKVYINGFEFKNGKWRRTLAALWHYLF